MPEKAPKPDCTTCGVCCIAPDDQDEFCDIDEADEKRLGSAFTRRYVNYPSFFDQLCREIDGRQLWGAIKTKWVKEKEGPHKGAQFCRCICLKGVVGKKVYCSVYEKRPRACREAVKPGDRACRTLQRAFAEIGGPLSKYK